jgi:hypothetical protein
VYRYITSQLCGVRTVLRPFSIYAVQCVLNRHRQFQAAPTRTSPICLLPLPRVLRRSLQVSFGQVIKLVGGTDELGNWKPENGFQMTWNDGDIWTAEINFPGDAKLDFKVRIPSRPRPGARWCFTCPCLTLLSMDSIPQHAMLTKCFACSLSKSARGATGREVTTGPSRCVHSADQVHPWPASCRCCSARCTWVSLTPATRRPCRSLRLAASRTSSACGASRQK